MLILYTISYSQGEVNQLRQLEALYQGQVGDGYSFCYKSGSGLEKIVVFDEILSVILKKYPLHSDKHVGENFLISFTRDSIIEEKTKKEVSTILRLQKLAKGHQLQK